MNMLVFPLYILIPTIMMICLLTIQFNDYLNLFLLESRRHHIACLAGATNPIRVRILHLASPQSSESHASSPFANHAKLKPHKQLNY
jgi:hypothetical protein